MLATSPPADSSAVMVSAFNKEGKRARTATNTAQGAGSIKGGTRNTHKISCHNTTSAAKTASALSAVMARCFIVEASPAKCVIRAAQWRNTQANCGSRTWAGAAG